MILLEKRKKLVSRAAAAAVLAALCAPIAAPDAGAAVVVTDRIFFGFSEIKKDGATVAGPFPVGFQPAPANPTALFGDSTTDVEARTAARAGAFEISANGTFVDRAFSFGNFDRVFSSAIIFTRAEISGGGPQEVFADFFLPPGFLEIADNNERLGMGGDLRARVSAEFSICAFGGICDLSPSMLFAFESVLVGRFGGQTVTPTAFSSNPALDLTPLLHETLGITGDEFQRTILWEYPAFAGQVSLGVFNPGNTVSVRYLITAEVMGPLFLTGASAAINDPFVLSADPIISFSSVPVAGIAVPEPGTIALLAFGLAGLGLARRRRWRE